MIELKVIQSSSKGNAICLYDGQTNLFLDFGADPKNINYFKVNNNISVNQIAAVLITHAHIDHTRALKYQVAKNLTVYGTKLMFKQLSSAQVKNLNLKNIEIEKWIKIPNSNWSFYAIMTLHNALGSVCYIIKNHHKTLLYLTDSEFFQHRKFRNHHAYIVEANYGAGSIRGKQANYKHLTNNLNHMNINQSEEFLHLYKGFKTRLFLFSHISPHSTDFSTIVKVVKSLSTKKFIVDFINPGSEYYFKYQFYY